MCKNCEPVDPANIHIVDVLDTEDGRLRAIISTNENSAHPIALHDQLSAQTQRHLQAMTNWYAECLEQHPEADDLERYVNLVSHLVYVFPERYMSNILARAVQSQAQMAEVLEEIKDNAEDLGDKVAELIGNLRDTRAERDALRELVIQYQSAAQEA